LLVRTHLARVDVVEPHRDVLADLLTWRAASSPLRYMPSRALRTTTAEPRPTPKRPAASPSRTAISRCPVLPNNASASPGATSA